MTKDEKMCFVSQDGSTKMLDIQINRHEIFPEFSGIPEFSRPQRSFSWKSQIRFNIYGGGGGVPYCVCSLTVRNVGMARLISSLSTYFKYWVITSFKCMFFVYM